MVKRQPLARHGHRKTRPLALRARFEGANGLRDEEAGGRDLLAAPLLLLTLPSAGGAFALLALGALLVPFACGALLLLELSPAAHAAALAALAALATAAAMANCRLRFATRQASAGDEGTNRAAGGEAIGEGAAAERSESASASASPASSPSFNSSP